MDMTLERFRKAHREFFETALAEIRSGKKTSHWIWFIFPQIQGLGRSSVAMYYEIQSRKEAMDYWADPVLSDHMIRICQALLKLEDPIEEIMGFPDNLKLRSSMTLFLLVTGEPIFRQVLDQFYGGSLDDYTQKKLNEI